MKNICLVTNWYPTKENPYVGLFFKEQAFCVSEHYNFIVLHYKEYVKKKFWKKYIVKKINEEKNTVEYNLHIFIPIFVYFLDLFYDFKRKFLSRDTEDGVGKYISSTHIKYSYRILKQLFNKNFDFVIDVLYCVDGQSEAAIVNWISKIVGKPYIVGEHAPVPWPGRVIKDIDKHAFEQADLFLAISVDKIRQLKVQNIKLPPIKYIGNLVDEEIFKINNKKKSDIKTFVIVASHSYYKNYDMFIAIMECLKEISEKQFKVLIVGYAADKGYAKNITEFEKKVSCSNFCDCMELIPEISHDKIVEIYNRADAFVMTSIQEGQPVSAMEAACCGLPIFATRCGGVEDYIDEKMGRIYSIVDANGMALDLKKFLDEDLVFDSQYIRNKVVSMFGKKAFINNFVIAFNEVIEDADA